MKRYIRRSVMASNDMSMTKANAEYIINQFNDYARDLKRYMGKADGWTVDVASVPEYDSDTMKIRNVSFALIFGRTDLDKKYKYMLLVKMFYDLANDPPMTVSVTCPALNLDDEYICNAYDFDSTNIEGLYNINIVPLLNQVDELVDSGEYTYY